MPEIKVKKKADIEREADDARRTELAMLKLLAKKYPSEAKKFTLPQKVVDKQNCIV